MVMLADAMTAEAGEKDILAKKGDYSIFQAVLRVMEVRRHQFNVCCCYYSNTVFAWQSRSLDREAPVLCPRSANVSM